MQNVIILKKKKRQTSTTKKWGEAVERKNERENTLRSEADF